MLRYKDICMNETSADNDILQLVNETVDSVVFESKLLVGCKERDYGFTAHLCVDIIEEILCNACDKTSSSCCGFNSSQKSQQLKSLKPTSKKLNMERRKLVSCVIESENLQNTGSISMLDGISTNDYLIVTKLMEIILQKVTFDALPSPILAMHNQSMQQNYEVKPVLSQPARLDKYAVNHMLSSSYPTTVFSTFLSFTEPIPGSSFKLELQLLPDSIESIAQKCENITYFDKLPCGKSFLSFDGQQKNLLDNKKDKLHETFHAEQSCSIAASNELMSLKSSESCSDSLFAPTASMPSNSTLLKDVKPQADLLTPSQKFATVEQAFCKSSEIFLNFNHSLLVNSSSSQTSDSRSCFYDNKQPGASSIKVLTNEPNVQIFSAMPDNKHVVVENQIEFCDLSSSDPNGFKAMEEKESCFQQHTLIEKTLNYSEMPTSFCDKDVSKSSQEHIGLPHDQAALFSPDNSESKPCLRFTLSDEYCLLDTEKKLVFSLEDCKEPVDVPQNLLTAQVSTMSEETLVDVDISKITSKREKVNECVDECNESTTLFETQDQQEQISTQSSLELLLNMHNHEADIESVNSQLNSSDGDLQLDLHKRNDLNTIDFSSSLTDLILPKNIENPSSCSVSNNQFNVKESTVAAYCTTFTPLCSSPIENDAKQELAESILDVPKKELLPSLAPEHGLTKSFFQEEKCAMLNPNYVENQFALAADVAVAPQVSLQEANNVLESSRNEILSQQGKNIFKESDDIHPKFSAVFLSPEKKLCLTPPMETQDADFSHKFSSNAGSSPVDQDCQNDSSNKINLHVHQLSPTVSENTHTTQTHVNNIGANSNTPENISSILENIPKPVKADTLSSVTKTDLLGCVSVSNNESWLKFVNDTAVPLRKIAGTAFPEPQNELLHACGTIQCLDDDMLNCSCFSGEELFSKIEKDAVVPDGETNYSFHTSDELPHSNSAEFHNSLKSDTLDDSFFADKLYKIVSPQIEQFVEDCDKVKVLVSPPKESAISNLMHDNKTAMQGGKVLIPTALLNTSSGQLVMRCPQTEKKEVHRILDWKPWAWKGDSFHEEESVAPEEDSKDFDDLLSPLFTSPQEVESLNTDECDVEKTFDNADKVEDLNQLSSQISEISGSVNKQTVSTSEQSFESVNFKHASVPSDASTLEELCAAEVRNAAIKEMHTQREQTQELVRGGCTDESCAENSETSSEEIISDEKIEETHSVTLDDNDLNFYGSKFSDKTCKYSDLKNRNGKVSFCEAFGAIENPSLSPLRKRLNCNLSMDPIPSVPEMTKISPKVAIHPTILDQQVPNCNKLVSCNLEEKLYSDTFNKLPVISHEEEGEDENDSDEEFQRTPKDDGLMNYDDCYMTRRPLRSNPYLRHSISVQSRHLDKLYRISPLKTCGGPRRVGLSRRRKVNPLHPHNT